MAGAVTVAGQISTRSTRTRSPFPRPQHRIVFQSFHLIPTMTAVMNVAVPLELRRGRRRLRARRAGARRGRPHRPSRPLSGRASRRAAARRARPRARAQSLDPGGGRADRQSRRGDGRQIIDLMFAGYVERAMTLVLDTHDASLARRCDRVVRMRSGPDRAGEPMSTAALSSSRSTSLRLALRDLRGGLRGFYVFIACIALGVMAIAGVGSFSESLSKGLARQGRVILGGDISFSLIQREASPRSATSSRRAGGCRSPPPCAPWRRRRTAAPTW